MLKCCKTQYQTFSYCKLSNTSTSIAGAEDYLDKVLCIFHESYSEFANTAHNNNMFGVVYSSIQKFTIILIMKPIIFISIMNKYLDISIYLYIDISLNCGHLVYNGS